MKEKKSKRKDEREEYEKEYLARLEKKQDDKPKKDKPKKDIKNKKIKSSDKLTTKSKKKSRKGSVSSIEEEDTGIVLIDDNLTIDKEKELEERRAYLEEARSQDFGD